MSNTTPWSFSPFSQAIEIFPFYRKDNIEGAMDFRRHALSPLISPL
jgi:hypothetical protein